MIWALAGASALAAVPAGLRWLRIAQREHYLASSVTRFALRWWTTGPVNPLLLLVGLAGVVGSLWDVRSGFLAVVAQFGPVGLSVKGTTSPLAWTARLRRLAGTTAGFVVLVIALGVAAESPLIIAVALVGIPLLVDLALLMLEPIEKRIGAKWVSRAAARLASSGADVVAITGSYGKTSTKGYVAHLIGGSFRTVASPASFNNRMGLARAINENLTPGTEVFVAEMGAYAPGEIAELCTWIPPKVAAIVAIGPVHLERFKTEERIVSAKSEILDRAVVGVLNTDHPLLAKLAAERSGSMTVIEASASGDSIKVDGEVVCEVPDGVFGANLAVALGIGKALGVGIDVMLDRVADLPSPSHRLEVGKSQSGVTVVDDTFNSNPAGARAGLRMLAEAGAQGRLTVVTPGMVELGPIQDDENESFAKAAARTVDHLVVVGMTNRRALLRGAAGGKAAVTVVDTRDDAVMWVRGNLGPGDAVLYENDLPDHYP